MIISCGELYYDHFSKFLREPISREVFENSEKRPDIQILKYENVFEDCIVYNSLGLSKYEEIVGINTEVSLVVDGEFDLIRYLFAKILFSCIGIRMQMGAGMAMRGLERLDQEFVQKYSKGAIYFTEPYAFPEEYRVVHTEAGKKAGQILLAFFITEAEYEYLITYGAEKFEELLEEKNVDPFNISRESVT